jgi:hypothetical protein
MAWSPAPQPDFLGRVDRGLSYSRAFLDEAVDVLQHHDRIVITIPTERVSASIVTG